MGDSDMRWINTLALVPLAVVLAAVLARLGDRAERRVAAGRGAALRRPDIALTGLGGGNVTIHA